MRLGVTQAEILLAPPADVALVRGPFPAQPQRVLIPLRGGPHAELVLNFGLALHPLLLHALHLRPTAATAARPGGVFRAEPGAAPDCRRCACTGKSPTRRRRRF
jgi:hypothetical protein